jgi:NADH dehydrogenase (ubiquinone) Fe-S protein 1
VRRPAEVELTIDGKKVSIEAGSALIQACEKAGVTIPRYCYHEWVQEQIHNHGIG